MHRQTSISGSASPTSNSRFLDIRGRVSTATNISPKIVNALSAFIRQTLGVEPHVKAYRALWECAWMDGACELSVFLNSEGGEFTLHVIYLEQVMNPPERRLQPADLQQLCQQLQTLTGLPTQVRM